MKNNLVSSQLAFRAVRFTEKFGLGSFLVPNVAPSICKKMVNEIL
jgi:hypothetical protein